MRLLADMHIVVLNNGAKAGTIVDFRLSLLSDAFSFAFFPTYIIDEEKWEALDRRRKHYSPLELAKKIHKETWCGMLLAKGESASRHLMFAFNSAGLREIPTGTFQVVLEYSAGFAWVPLTQYNEFTFDEWSRGELAKGATFNLGTTFGDRSWPKTWKDEDELLMEKEVEARLGVDEPDAK